MANDQGMFSGFGIPSIQDEEDQRRARELQYAQADPGTRSVLDSYSLGRNLGRIAGALTGTDVRSPAEKQRDSIAQIKANVAAAGLEVGSDDYYRLLVSQFSSAGMVDAANAANQAWENLKKERAQTGSYERANQPKPVSGKERLATRLDDINEKLVSNPDDPLLLQAKSNLERILNVAQKETPDWKLVQPTQFSPGYMWNAKTGEKKSLGGATGGIQGGTADSQGLAGEDFLGSLPKPKADQVRALAEGRMQFPAGFALKSPYWQEMISAVSQYDPSFDAVNYNARSKTRNAFVSGKEGQSLNALNTVMGHLDELEKASAALNNTDYPLLNRALNFAGSQMSPDLKGRLNAFKLNVQAVASEMERAYRGTGGNMAEIEAWKATMDAADSPTAIRAGLRQATKLLGSKIDALGDQYSKGMGQTSQGLTLLTPRAQETYDRLVGNSDQSAKQNGGTARVQFPDGRTGTIPRSKLSAAKARGATELR